MYTKSTYTDNITCQLCFDNFKMLSFKRFASIFYLLQEKKREKKVYLYTFSIPVFLLHTVKVKNKTATSKPWKHMITISSAIPFCKESVFWNLSWVIDVVGRSCSKSNLPLDGDILKRLAIVAWYLPVIEQHISLIRARNMAGFSINFQYTCVQGQLSLALNNCPCVSSMSNLAESFLMETSLHI